MKYIAILRGINVGGRNIIKMAPFKDLLLKNGFESVETYIQSGNIALNSSLVETADIETKLSTIINDHYGYTVPIIVRQKVYIDKIVAELPFNAKEIDYKKLHLTFLEKEPQIENIDNLLENNFTPDKFIIIKNAVYVYCPNGYGKTKINNTFFEKKLKVKATTRNWKSVLKLQEMLS